MNKKLLFILFIHFCSGECVKQDLKQHVENDLPYLKSKSTRGLEQGLGEDLKHPKSDLTRDPEHRSRDVKHGFEPVHRHTKSDSKHSPKQSLIQGFEQVLKPLKRDLTRRSKPGSKDDLRQRFKRGSKRDMAHGSIPDLNEQDSSERLLHLPLLGSEELPPPPFGLDVKRLGGDISPTERCKYCTS